MVEGDGEVRALPTLLAALSTHLNLWRKPWGRVARYQSLNHWHIDNPRRGPQGVKAALDVLRREPRVGGVLLLVDADAGCPATAAPEVAARIVDEGLPFPVAYVMLNPEYEVLFLPCLDRMAGFAFPPGLRWPHAEWESGRGVKNWLSKQLPSDQSYKPSVDQARMTRALDLEQLARADVPCFGSLVRAVTHLQTQSGGVYPNTP